MTKTVGNRRLLALAAFLRTLPQKRFDYGLWVGSDWRGAQDLSCGTTACAFGWAATMPQFRRLGLRIDRDGMPCIARLSVMESAERLFGLDGVESDYLFYPNNIGEEQATPKYVARKIERFVRGRTQ